MRQCRRRYNANVCVLPTPGLGWVTSCGPLRGVQREAVVGVLPAVGADWAQALHRWPVCDVHAPSVLLRLVRRALRLQLLILERVAPPADMLPARALLARAVRALGHLGALLGAHLLVLLPGLVCGVRVLRWLRRAACGDDVDAANKGDDCGPIEAYLIRLERLELREDHDAGEAGGDDQGSLEDGAHEERLILPHGLGQEVEVGEGKEQSADEETVGKPMEPIVAAFSDDGVLYHLHECLHAEHVARDRAGGHAQGQTSYAVPALPGLALWGSAARHEDQYVEQHPHQKHH
mmetsp:Transcript_63337/g.196164  ORF Transcript_63337/g.196164 Transcript_63337/m.196164 type:complete len:292 (-) Transcript_63337:574-1449(-)